MDLVKKENAATTWPPKKMCGFIDTFNREVEQNLPYGTLYPTKDMMLQNDCCPRYN